MALDGTTQYKLVLVEGIMLMLVLSAAGLLIWLPIIRYKALRDQKEWLLVAGMCFADFISGFGDVGSAFFNLVLAFQSNEENHKANITLPRMYCAVNPFFWMSGISKMAQGLCMVLLALDRLLLVLRPATWFGAYTVTHAKIALWCVFGIATTNQVISFIRLSLIPDYRTEFNYCTTQAAMMPWQFRISMLIFVLGTMSAALLQCVTAFAMHWKAKKVASTSATVATGQEHAAHQQAFTHRVTQSMVAAIILILIPYIYILGFSHKLYARYDIDKAMAERINLQFIMLMYCDPAINAVIFLRKNKLLKYALKALVTGKILPDNLESWNYE